MIRDKTFLYGSNELDQDKWVKAIRRSFSSSQSFLKMEWKALGKNEDVGLATCVRQS